MPLLLSLSCFFVALHDVFHCCADLLILRRLPYAMLFRFATADLPRLIRLHADADCHRAARLRHVRLMPHSADATSFSLFACHLLLATL